MRIAVIGGLASGPAAAAEAARANPEADVVLFEEAAAVSVGACEIPYFVAGRMPADYDLQVLTPERLAETRDMTVYTRHRVTKIDPNRGTLQVTALDHGAEREEDFDRFILATGAGAKKLGVPGEDAPGVFPIRGYADAHNLKQWLNGEPVRHVVVVGSGFVGFEMAEAMRDMGYQTTLLAPGNRILELEEDDPIGTPFFEGVREGGAILRNDRATGLGLDDRGAIAEVRTDSGERIGCQCVIMAIGLTPRTELAEGAGIRIGKTGAIATDDRMKTSHRNVWACGDAVEVEDVITGKPVVWPQAPIGRRTARVAARNAASRRGAVDRYAGTCRSMAVKAFGVEHGRVGYVRAEDARKDGFDAAEATIRHWTRVSEYPGAERIHVRLVGERGSGRLLGGALTAAEGAALRANVLVPLVRTKATAEDLAEDVDLVYNPPIAPSVDALKIAASALLKKG